MLKRLALTLLITALGAFAVLQLPIAHRAWLRHKVASKVYEVRATKDGGGGTGFAVKAPSGISYILTNAHVCEHLSDDGDKGSVLVIRGSHAVRRRVLEISENSDLCILEGMPGVDGLSLGSMAEVGDMINVVGHPLLGPTTMTSGEVRAIRDAVVLHHIMMGGSDERLDKAAGATDEACDLPKEEVFNKPISFLGVPLGSLKVCLVRVHDAYDTTAMGMPGNSGSPVVDRWGRVVGVLFAGDNETNWSVVVNYWDVRTFLARW